MIFLVLLPAAICDLYCYRVPHIIIIMGLGLSLYHNFMVYGLFHGVIYFSVGCIIPLIVCSFFYLLRMLGAADIKLISIISSYYSLVFSARVMFYALLAGALFSTLKILRKRNLFRRFLYFSSYIKQVYREKRLIPYYASANWEKEAVIPFPSAFCLGTAFVSVSLHRERWNMYKICYIYLRDSEYATQFVTYFRQKLPKQVEIKMISERQEPMEISEAAIVISDDRQFLEEFSREGIYLSSQPVTDKENEIFMYQKRERIWQNFCEITKMEQEIEGKRRKKGRICCIFSPEGGEEKTRLALQEALECSKYLKVLYISMCGVPVFFPEELKETPSIFHQGLAEWILAAENGKAEESLQSLAYSYGKISILAPVAHYKDLLDFSLQEIESMMEGLRKQSLFDRVIVEVGQFFEYTFHLLDQADEILMPLEDGFLAAIRRHVLREYCIAEKKEAVWEQDFVLRGDGFQR